MYVKKIFLGTPITFLVCSKLYDVKTKERKFMQTINYKLELLTQNQAMKEFNINHAFDKIDWLINRSAIDFINELPIDKSEGEYIIHKGIGRFRRSNIFRGEMANAKAMLWCDNIRPEAGRVLYD
jgi:hypothetical protein